MVTTTLKLRADLQSAEVVDADGVLYYDVTDPRTGGVLRLFDYEWLIAQKLDGQRGFDELARWTEEQFGFAASREDLQTYAERLQQLGVVEGTPAAAAKPLPAALYAASALKVLGVQAGPVKATAAAAPTPAPTAAPTQAPAPVAMPAPAPTPEPARPLVSSKPPAAAVSRPLEKPSEPVERRASRDEDALMGQQILPTRPAPLSARPTPVQTPSAAAPPLAAPVAAPLSTPVSAPVAAPVQTPVAAAPPPAEREPTSQPQPMRRKSDMQAAIESLPPPVEEPPTAAAPVELVQPPAPQPEPVAAPVSAPVAVRTPESSAPSAPTAPTAPTVTPAQIPIEQEPVARPVEALAEPRPPVAEPVPAERPVVPVAEPVKPVSPQPVAMQPERPTPLMPQPVINPTAPPEKTSSAGTWFVILVILAVLAVAAYYFLVLRQPQSPPAVSVSVSVAKPEDVTRSFATAAVVKAAEPQPLKIEGDGTVTKVVDENTEVQPNTVLVELDTQSKFAKELAELHERLTFYQKKLDSAKNKNKPDLLRDAQQKISEKQQRLEQVEALVKKSQLMAPRSGAVSKVMVKVGQAVTAGTEVVSLTDKALAAEIKIPAIEAQGMKVGQDAQLSGSAGALTARVAGLRTEGDYATVSYSLPENAAAKPGDELKLQKAPLSQVVRLPTAALVEGSKVFVLRDGKAATVPVTVADREGDAVLLQGLPSGEQVIVSHPTELHEGSAVRVGPAGSP